MLVRCIFSFEDACPVSDAILSLYGVVEFSKLGCEGAEVKNFSYNFSVRQLFHAKLKKISLYFSVLELFQSELKNGMLDSHFKLISNYKLRDQKERVALATLHTV